MPCSIHVDLIQGLLIYIAQGFPNVFLSVLFGHFIGSHVLYTENFVRYLAAELNLICCATYFQQLINHYNPSKNFIMGSFSFYMKAV